jgi:hypothetical protein
MILRQFKNHRHEIAVVAIFFLFLLIQLFVLMSGLAWVYLDPAQFSFWMLVFVAMLAIVAGVVATYSFVQYTQEGSLRSFVITMLGANVILLAFLYLLTHPVTTWSVFSGRERNITIVATLGFLVAPGVLGGSLVGHRPLTRRARNIVLLWGLVIQPAVALTFLFSPEPVFVLTGQGPANLSFAGWTISIVFGVSTTVSLVRYIQEWLRTRESITLASALALVLWILSFMIYLAIDSPIQVAELLWFSGVADGFVLLAVTMIMTSIIEPHRALESVVKERTAQLEESRKETEFYLRLWTHKIGNLLQGITTYLDLIELEAEKFPSLSRLQKLASDLVVESTTVNRQVEKLIRIKAKGTSVTWPVNITHALADLDMQLRETQDSGIVLTQLSNIDHELQVLADDLIEIAFSNLIALCMKQRRDNGKKTSVRIKESKDSIQVFLSPCSSQAISEIEDWSVHNPSLKNSVVDLDLFMTWLIMQRYDGSIGHRLNPHSKVEELVLTFKRAS